MASLRHAYIRYGGPKVTVICTSHKGGRLAYEGMAYEQISPVFSPTQTTDFLRDPGMWYFRHVERWHPRFIGKKEVAGILGGAIADGVAVYHNGLKADIESAYAKEALAKQAAAVAIESVKEGKARVHTLGQSVYEDQAQAWELLEKRAAEGVFKYVLYCPFKPEDILGVELSLPNHGYCRIDLVVDSHLGPMVVDLKTKLTLDIKYQAQTLREFEESWQMLHYVWAYQDHLEATARATGVGLGTVPRMRRFAIILLVLEPKSRLPLVHPIVVNPELLALWHHSATQVWRLMDAMKRGVPVTIDPRPWSTFNFYSKFGREDWADAFTKFFLDPGALPVGYIQEKKRES